MIPLQLSSINSWAPYKVKDAGTSKYEFVTDTNITYLVGFMEDSMVENYESYQFYITNETGQQSPNDLKLWQTVFAIIEEFFKQNQSVMVYWCDTSDGHEALRARLFSRKFNIYSNKDNYIFKSIETTTEGIPYYAALVYRKDHPYAEDISMKIDFVVSELTNK